MDALRTCVACRVRAPRAQLIRVVVCDGQIVLDDRAVLPGRGAWVHETAQCLKLAVERGSFSRSLKVSRQLDTRPVENRLKTLMDN